MSNSDRGSFESSEFPGVLLLDSIAYVAQTKVQIADRLIVSGSHGGSSAVAFLIDHAQKPSLAFFNDAGGGLDDAGICGLKQLEQIGVAACAYSHWSARIGDARSGLESGVISQCNALALGRGIQVGTPVRQWLPAAATTSSQINALIEPDPSGKALRQFTDPSYQVLAKTLSDVRAGIDTLDDQIVALLAKRAMWVKDAARFKANAFQVAAPARQAQVFARVRQLAARHNLGFDGFEDVVEQAYRSLVKQFIANEGRYHAQMKSLEPASK